MRREKLLAAAVLTFTALAWIWFATDQPGDLLPLGSVRLGSVASWTEPSGGTSSASGQKIYFWTTRGDLLHLIRNMDGSNAVIWEYLTPVNSLQTSMAGPARIPADALTPTPTPDGSEWIYGLRKTGPANDIEMHGVTLDGPDRVLPALWMPNVVWMPDGQHWIISRAEGDYLNSLDGTPSRKLNTTSVAAVPPYVLGATAQGHVVSTQGSDLFEPPTPFGRRFGLHTPTGTLTEFDPAAPANNPQNWTVTMPEEAARGRILFSPHADRILWITEKQASGLALWFTRLRLGFTRPYDGDEAIYVSQRNGSGMKKLFSGPVERQKRKWGTATTPPLTDIRWLPDGKRISFVYKDNLYIAPVD